MVDGLRNRTDLCALPRVLQSPQESPLVGASSLLLLSTAAIGECTETRLIIFGLTHMPTSS